VLALGGGDELEHGGLVACAEQLDRVGIAVDDALEERLAVLVGRQRALRPAAHLVEQHRQAGVRLAELVGDLALDPLGQRGGGARGGDRDRERAGAHDRGQDEVAQRRDVDDVDEHRPPLGVLVHADVDVGVVGGGDRDEGRLEVAGLVVALQPLDRSLGGELTKLRYRLGRHEDHAAVAGE
jgi:hypothetical protein